MQLKRINPNALAEGIHGFVTPQQMGTLINRMYEHEGLEYYVIKKGFDNWLVVKCDGSGPLSEYNLKLTNDRLSCNCMSGSRHLECRHKAMVADGWRKDGP